MNYNEQREAARKFALKWQKKGDEKRDAHNFWIELLSNVIGIENGDISKEQAVAQAKMIVEEYPEEPRAKEMLCYSPSCQTMA